MKIMDIGFIKNLLETKSTNIIINKFLGEKFLAYTVCFSND